jgi:SAM-dependent methyltransferase
VGHEVGADGSFAAYEAVGRATRAVVEGALPADWSWRGKRVLDFGCGAGRTLRHFLDEAGDGAEFWGCDIDAASIAWLNANLDPPIRGFVNGARPPLAQPDDRFDLIYAYSVFTHIGAEWSAWLLELHRVLVPGGLLVASFLGSGHSEAVAGEPWEEDRIGMNVLRAHGSWELGGPMVLMSPWWIHEHWGRAFDIVSLRDDGVPGVHGIVVARARREAPPCEELERIDPGDPREVRALEHNVRQLQRESADASAALAATVAHYEGSQSWRITAPLRSLAARVRRRA